MQLEFEDFKGGYTGLNGTKNMDISRMDLCRCTMQVGYKSKIAYKASSLYKRLELLFMVMANVEGQSGELVLKREFSDLDQSEKVGVSYQIGQGLTKAVAERYFDVLWVAHFSTMKNGGCQFRDGGVAKRIIALNTDKGKEPDLVGYDRRGQMHLFESKGTSKNRIQGKSFQKAINQVSNYIGVTDYNGNVHPFTTRNACFFAYKNCFYGKIVDPPIDEKLIYKDDIIGYFSGIYNYYYDFLFGDKDMNTIQEAGRSW